MIDQSPLPSRQLQLFARLARWSLGLVLAFWLLVLAVWGTLHGFIVPRIDMWRAEVEQMATQALGAPVRIEAVSGKTDGLFPSIHLQGLAVLDPKGREALKLPTIIATISARSVLRWGLEQLYVQAPEIDIRHLADGRWQVAGLDMVQSDASESPALRWLLEQPELVIEKGKLHFTDEQKALRTVHLHDVDVVLRNRHWSHVLRLEASPEQPDGERMQLIGAFREPLLPSSQAPWKHWSGQWYAQLQLHRIPQLPWATAWNVAAIEGNGQARVWLDVQHGEPIGMTADLALANANVRWSQTDLPAFDVHQLQGRLSLNMQRQGEGWQIQGKNFSFQHSDGSLWPSSNWSVQSREIAAQGRRIHVQLDYADMAMASKVIAALPLPQKVKQPAARWQPQGAVRQLDLQWASNGDYQAKGEVQGLALQAQPAETEVGIPGLEGMQLRFDLNHKGGKAELHMQDGVLHFPGVFEEPALPLQQLDAQVRWSLVQGRLKVEVPQASFANPDAQGSLKAWWQMGESEANRLPGHLHLTGQLDRADGARVHRYLPLQVPEIARHYVRDSVQQGTGKNVQFEVSGDLQNMPFSQPGSGRFYIKAPLHDVTYAFVPSHMSPKGAAWPTLQHLSGDFIFEGTSMAVQHAKTDFAGYPQLHIGSITTRIADLSHPVVQVQAQGNTALMPLLDLVRRTPLAAYTSHALDASQAKGNAHVEFALELPIDHLEKSKAQGKIGFQNTALQFNADTPWLTQLQGAVEWSENGFALQQVQGQSLGASIQLTGGMPSLQQGVHIKAQGVATAQGLQQDAPIALLQAISAHAQGKAAYNVDIHANDNHQQVIVRSDLRGMALSLPAPFGKSQDTQQPLTVQQSVTSGGEQTLRVTVPNLLHIAYAKGKDDSRADAIKGLIAVGAAASKISDQAPLPAGVQARIHLEQLDADAWLSAFPLTIPTDAPKGKSEANAYLPRAVQLQTQHLRFKDRDLHDVTAEFSESNGTWRGQFKAQQFAGYAQYRTPAVLGDSGRVFARLTHLQIPKSEVQRLDAAPSTEEEQSISTLPALDIEVEQLEIAGKSLGKLELKARNTQGRFGRDWLLEQFNLTTPEAQWKANGSWASTAQGLPRSTQLGFLLEMESSGKLLERMGMPGVIRNGQGRLSGTIAWHGSPISPDWHSMDGGVHMQVEQGQFLKAEPGMAKLLSVLSLQSLTRRMNLDFRDVFSQGFAFDFIRGDVSVEQGVARTNNLQMKGLNAAVLMEGQASLVHETQDLRVVVVPEINAMTASLAATAINPVVGVGSFLAQMFLRGPLMEAATRSFHIHGTWTDPVVDAMKNQPRKPVESHVEGGAP